VFMCIGNRNNAWYVYLLCSSIRQISNFLSGFQVDKKTDITAHLSAAITAPSHMTTPPI